MDKKSEKFSFSNFGKERIKDVMSKMKNTLTARRNITIVVLGALFFALFGLSANLFIQKGGTLPKVTELEQLVPERVSQNATIHVVAPEGVSASDVQANLTFLPPISGKWIVLGARSGMDSEKNLYFKPAESLTLGAYYRATLNLPSYKEERDMLVEEDPRILSVFPGEAGEADEYTPITVIFNRPMVALSSIEELEQNSASLGIILEPQTKGVWKWISTRNLQFIPQTHLVRSANYTVSIPSIVGVEGLTTKATVYRFHTRPLRHSGTGATTLRYNQPFYVIYNQPIDLAKTGSEVTVTSDGKSIPVTVAYGTRRVKRGGAGEVIEQKDPSILAITPQRDQFGRSGFWNFKSTNIVTVPKSYPQKGNIPLDSAITTTVTITDVIEGVSATSERTNHSEALFFDPTGTLWVTFAEDVAIDRLQVVAQGLKQKKYAEQCTPQGDGEYQDPQTCEKVPMKSKVGFTFDSALLPQDTSFELHFTRIENLSGTILTPNPRTIPLKVYSRLQVVSTDPNESSAEGSVSRLTICTNSPLREKEQVGGAVVSSVKAQSGHFVLGGWESPYKNSTSYLGMKCPIGTFVNSVRYGLIPESLYQLTLSLTDDFGQTAKKDLSFTTGKPERAYMRLQNLQKQYNVTTPLRTKLTYVTENFPYVNMRICKVSAMTLLTFVTERMVAEGQGEPLCIVEKFERIELPKKYWVNNFFQIDIKSYFPEPMGNYIVTLSHPDYRYDYNSTPIVERIALSVTNLAVTEKRLKWSENEESGELGSTSHSRAQNLYWVARSETLAPVAGALVTPYQTKYINGKNTLIRGKGAVTDLRGISEPRAVSDMAGVVVEEGIDSTIVSGWADRVHWASQAYDFGRAYIYTDRPIYKPGDTVHVKIIDRVGYDGAYETRAGKKINLRIQNSAYDEVKNELLIVSAVGTIEAAYVIPLDAPLGSYQITTPNGFGSFAVEEYRGAAFAVSAKTMKDEYIVGETLEATIDAKYYFGVPLDGGTVEYSITAQDYYFDKAEFPGIDFGAGWYGCYSCGYGDSYVARGKVALDTTGHGVLRQALDFEKLFKTEEIRKQGKIFALHFTVKDKSGQSVSTQSSAIVHRGAYYIGLGLGEWFIQKGGTLPIAIKTVDTTGKVQGVNNITLEIARTEWKSFRRQEVDGSFYWRSEKKRDIVRTEVVDTDRNGDYSSTYSPTGVGEYEVVARGKDEQGNAIEKTSTFYVSGGDTVDIRMTNNETLEVIAEKTEVRVGDRPKILIKSPYAKAKALITVERGKLFTHEIVDIEGSIFAYEVPIHAEYAPNVFVSVLLLSPRPELKFGTVEFRVGNESHTLDVKVTPNKLFYLPGEEVELSVVTKDYFGIPVQAEVSIAVADLSVLALSGNPKKNPLLFFYGGFPLVVETLSNVKNMLYESEIPTGTKGGGGGSPTDLAKKKRGEFRDTAMWAGDVQTDVSGLANIKFRLPDNLTTWQIESVGVTWDTKLGVDYKEFTTRKDLMVVPLFPRFVIPGDQFVIGAKVFNQTKETQEFFISLETATLVLDSGSDAQISVRIAPNETRVFSFPVTAPRGLQKGEHRFTLSAKNPAYEDVVTEIIPISSTRAYEAVVTSGRSTLPRIKEYVRIPKEAFRDAGELTVRANATLAVYLPEAVDALLAYPYGCSEQIASTLRTLAVASRAIPFATGTKQTISYREGTYTISEVVTLGVSQIAKNQNSEGGFSYYSDMDANVYLTESVLVALVAIQGAGYAVPPGMITRAGQYIENQLRHGRPHGGGVWTTRDYIRGYISLEGVDGQLSTRTYLGGLIATELRRTSNWKESIDNGTLVDLARISAKIMTTKNDKEVITILRNRVAIDGRGASLGASLGGSYWYYDRTVGLTALLVDALAQRDANDELIEKLLRYIGASKSKDGSWGSTSDTAEVVNTMVNYLARTGEARSSFALALSLNGQAASHFSFAPQNIFSTLSHMFSISEFDSSKMNVITLEKTHEAKLGSPFYYDMVFRYVLPVESLPPRDEGFTITRGLYPLADARAKEQVQKAVSGEVLRGHLTIAVPKDRTLVGVESPIPAGFEMVNFNFATEDRSMIEGGEVKSGGEWGEDTSLASLDSPVVLPVPVSTGFFARLFGGGPFRTTESSIDDEDMGYFDITKEHRARTQKLYPSSVELRRDRVLLFVEHLAPGVYSYDYYIRALQPGTYQHPPASASELYFPEHFGRTRGEIVTVSAD